MQDLHRILIVGASVVLSSRIAEIFPEPRQEKPADAAALARMAAAERKRLRRQDRNRTLTT